MKKGGRPAVSSPQARVAEFDDASFEARIQQNKIFCKACCDVFKTDRQTITSHIRSNKHQQNKKTYRPGTVQPDVRAAVEDAEMLHRMHLEFQKQFAILRRRISLSRDDVAQLKSFLSAWESRALELTTDPTTPPEKTIFRCRAL